MTAVQTAKSGTEPLDLKAVPQRRTPRGQGRGQARFPMQLAEASAGLPDRAPADAAQRTGVQGRKPGTGHKAEPDDTAALPGGIPLQIAPDAPPAAEPAAVTAALPPSDAQPAAEGPEGLLDRPAGLQAARTPATAAGRDGKGVTASGPADAGASPMPAEEGALDPMAAVTAAQALPAAAAPLAGMAQPAHRVQPPADPMPEAISPPGGPPRSGASPTAAGGGRRQAANPAGPAPTEFRLEPAGRATAAAPGAEAAARTPAPEQALPADILVACSGPDLAGLDVTIAAATPDLRDRFRAATGELRAELSAIGAEVDAIRVEVRAELADGGTSSGARERGGPGGEMDRAETGRGEPDATARLDLADPGAGPSPEREASPDDGRGSADRNESDSAGSPEQGGGSGNGQRARGSTPGVDQLRLRLDAGAGSSRRPAADDGFRAAPAHGAHRIDRYA